MTIHVTHRYLMAAAITALTLIAGACTGRKADNMVPLNETVEVKIAPQDEAIDSAVAAGDTGADSVASPEEQPGIEVL